MSIGETQTSTLIERTGIETVPESARIAKPRHLFMPWFAANVSVFGMSYGAWVLDFGISLWQAAIVSVIGIVISFLLCGIIAIAGKRSSTPTMVISRAAFGVHGQKVPGIVSWLTSIGWETFLAITAVLATATVITQLGGDGGTVVKLIATVLVALLIVLASVLGYHTIMKMQAVLTWITGLMTLVYLGLAIPHIDLSVALSVPNGSLGQSIGALVMVMTGFGLGWINIAADWSRYQRRSATDGAIVFWNTVGGSVAPVVLVLIGLFLVASDAELGAAISLDPVGALASILPMWVLLPFLLTAVLSLVSGAVLGIYSSGLTLLSLGIRMPRPAAAAIDGILLTIGTVVIVFFAKNFADPFQAFLITLGVPLAAWAGVLTADIIRRKRDYDEAALFHADGRYGAWDWTSILTMLVASMIGWGFVTNEIFTWQGYLLGMIGGREGDWAYANLGVFFALVISFIVTYVLRARKIQRQEAL